jgi:hypothetical protein
MAKVGFLRVNLMASKDVLVCGTLNLETTLPVDAFPLAYEPVCYRRFELRSQPSGVGFNVARALTVLGNHSSDNAAAAVVVGMVPAPAHRCEAAP